MSRRQAARHAPEPHPAYDQDFHAWALHQARLIRENRLGELDVANVAEEIESLGRSERRELRSRIQTLIEQLLKLEASSAPEPRRRWRETVRRSRREIETLLKESPSLRPDLPTFLAEEFGSTAQFTARLLDEAGESSAAVVVRSRSGGYSPEQVFGEWLPPDDGSRSGGWLS